MHTSNEKRLGRALLGNHWSGYSWIIVAGALWGTIGVFITELTKAGLDAGTISFLRVFFAFFLSMAILVVRGGWKSVKISKKGLIHCALLGIVCHGIYNIFYCQAVALTGVSISAVLLNVAPVTTLLTSMLLFREQCTGNKVIGIVINIIGCVLAVTGGQLSFVEGSVMGILFGVGAGICYGMTAIFGRFAAEKENPLTVSTYSYLFAAIALAIYAAPGKSMMEISGKTLLLAAAFALIPTVIAYLLYYKGVEQVQDVSRVPVFASVEIIVAAVFGLGLYHENLGGANVAGIVLVLLSIAIMNRKKEANAMCARELKRGMRISAEKTSTANLPK